MAKKRAAPATYLTYAEYNAYGTGIEMDEAEYLLIAPIADIVINNLISRGGNISNPPPNLLRAVAYQIGYIQANGGIEGIGDTSPSSESIGDYSWTSPYYGDKANNTAGIALHPLVISLLLYTGLLYRGGRHAR